MDYNRLNNGLNFFRDIKALYQMLKDVNVSVLEVNRIRRGEIDGIKLYNYQMKGYVLLTCILQIAFWGLFFFLYEMSSLVKEVKLYVIMVIYFVIMVIITFVLARIAFYTFKYYEDCYLTKEGIIFIPILFLRDKCAFSYMKEYSDGSKKVYIEVITAQGSHRESKWCFAVRERMDEAEEIISELKIK